MIKFFDYLGRLSLVACVLAVVLLIFEKIGTIFFVALLVSSLGSFLYIWYQWRLKAIGKMYSSKSGGRDLLLACTLPIVVLIVSGALFIRNYSF